MDITAELEKRKQEVQAGPCGFRTRGFCNADRQDAACLAVDRRQ